MSDRMKFNDHVTVGGQPDADAIKSLAADGFKAVINFRTEGEDQQPLSPDEAGQKVEEAGMKYVHIPVSMNSMDHSKVDHFREQFQSLPKPIFAHCKSGARAGAMTMMHVAVEQNMTGEHALEKAEQMGFKCDKPELKEFVKSYVDSRTPPQD